MSFVQWYTNLQSIWRVKLCLSSLRLLDCVIMTNQRGKLPLPDVEACKGSDHVKPYPLCSTIPDCHVTHYLLVITTTTTTTTTSTTTTSTITPNGMNEENWDRNKQCDIKIECSMFCHIIVKLVENYGYFILTKAISTKSFPSSKLNRSINY